MLPSINFGFLICTYLPGIPITVILYITQIVQMLEPEKDQIYRNTIIIFYVIISPLIFGLLLDALRHSLPVIYGWLFNPKEQENENPDQKKICIFWSHREHYRRKYLDKLEDSYNVQFLKHIINIYAVQYHMYEFFHNLALSNFLVTLPYLAVMYFTSDKGYPKYGRLFWIVFGISLLSIFFGIIMNKENQELIDEYIRPKPKSEETQS
jgi:hypothetical protein